VAVDYAVDVLCVCLAAVFDDGDEETLRRSKLCQKGSRHFMKSEVHRLNATVITNSNF